MLTILLAGASMLFAQGPKSEDFGRLSLQEAVALLTRSPWARQETYTRILGGIGSGLSGEKEIYSTFFVRFLSARPIREAYARVRQIQANYDKLPPEEKLRLDRALEPGLTLDVSRWIVLTVGFRSNDPSVELRVRQFLEVQTTESMRLRAYLSTVRFPQLKLAAYFPPHEDEVGAKFVFPRSVGGVPVISGEDAAVSVRAGHRELRPRPSGQFRGFGHDGERGSRHMKRTFLIPLLWCLVGQAHAAVLKGKVVDGQGNPIVSLVLSVVGNVPGAGYAPRTDEQGSFLQEVAAGVYAISLATGSDEILIRVEATEERELVLQAENNRLVALETRISMEPPGDPENDPSLAGIRDYEVERDGGETDARQVRASAEIVNPFPAQKGGRLHGSLYHFHRNDNFDARNFFDPLGEPLPEYKRNQFGATLAAAVTKSVNVLGTFEGLRIVQGSTLLSHIPTSAMKRGDFGGLSQPLIDPVTATPFDANRIPESRIHPVSRGLLSLLPDPNREDPDRNYVNSKPVVRNRNTWSVRLDHQLSGGSNYVVRYWLTRGNDVFVHPLPSFGSSRESSDQDASLSHTQKITNRLIATGRIGFARSTTFLSSVNAGRTGLLASVGIPGLSVEDPDEEGFPDFRLSGYSSFGDSGLPVDRDAQQV